MYPSEPVDGPTTPSPPPPEDSDTPVGIISFDEKYPRESDLTNLPYDDNEPDNKLNNYKFWRYILIVVIGLIAFCVSIAWPPHNIWLHLGVSCTLALGYGWLLSGSKKGNDVDRANLFEGEELKVSTRRHKVVLWPSFLLIFVGVVGLVFALGTFISGTIIDGFHIGYLIMALSLVILLIAATIIEVWRCNWWDVTDRRWIRRREQSSWLVFVTRSVDPEQLNQVVDANYSVGRLGDKFGWGTITIELRRKGEIVAPDSWRVEVLRYAPRVIELYNAIRDGSPITNPRP